MIFQDRSLWNHDHQCTHAEDVAISCDLEASSREIPSNKIVLQPQVTESFTLIKGVEECGIRLSDVIPRITGEPLRLMVATIKFYKINGSAVT